MLSPLPDKRNFLGKHPVSQEDIAVATNMMFQLTAMEEAGRDFPFPCADDLVDGSSRSAVTQSLFGTDGL
jgi:hypothetical protein